MKAMKEEIRQILNVAGKKVNELKQKFGEEDFNEFINRQQFCYNGHDCGETFSDWLTEYVYHELTATEREAYKKWAAEHLTRISSEKVLGPRGEYYVYIELFDGKIYAVGEAQGNYAGGITASMSFGGRLKITENIIRFSDSPNDSHRRFYEQVKDIPIMTDDEYEQMKQQRQQWPRDFDYWTWFK
jgi:hypothetical protein